jgi:hypothetical protein
MPSWKKVIISGSNAALNSLNVSTSLTASGLFYPTTDNGEESFLQTNGSGNLSFQYVKTIYEELYNGEATTILKGTPVYVSGSVGAASVVFRADAGNPAKMPVIYISADNIAAGATGRGIALGLITGVNTTGYPAGTEIYIAVGGGWTSTRPTGSAIVQALGYVTKEGAGGQGVVLNPGPNSLPNIPAGNVWVGNSSSYPIAIATSSLSVASASFAVSSSRAVSSSFASTASVSSTSVITTQDTTPVTYNVVFTGGTSGNQSLNVDATTLTYNPSTTTFTCPNLAGNASTATSASHASTASFINRLNQNVIITGSLNMTGSLGVNGLIRSVYPPDPGAGAITAELLAFTPSPYGITFRAYESGVHSIQNQREVSDSELFGISLQPLGGNVGIRTLTPAYPLDVSASVSGTSIYATGDIVAFSDQSVKENIRPIENVLERIGDSRGVLYDRIDNGEKDNIGFIAQELEVAFPELVITNEDGTKAVKYQNAVAVLFEAIKEQQKQINGILKLLNK